MEALSSVAPRQKIALILSGLPRSWQTLPSQLALFKNHYYDVFFHFWDTIPQTEKDAIVEMLKPRAYVFERPRDFSSVDADPLFKKDNISVPSRMFSQYYSWRSVGLLFQPFMADYTIAMRSRADLRFVYPIEQLFPRVEPNHLWIPWWEKNQLLSDLFAIGGVEPILYYHGIYDHLYYYASKEIFNSEILLMRHLRRRRDIRIFSSDQKYFFVNRPHMADYTIQQAMNEHPGQNKWLDPEIVKAHRDFYYNKDGDKGVAHVERFRHFQLRKLTEKSRTGP